MKKVIVSGLALVRFKKIIEIHEAELDEFMRDEDMQGCQVTEDDLDDIHCIHSICAEYKQ